MTILNMLEFMCMMLIACGAALLITVTIRLIGWILFEAEID